MNNSNKVFCIGFMKTGTTTMHEALEMLGYRVCDNSWRWLPEIVRGDWDTIKAKIVPWDVFEDNPIPLIFEKLDELCPKSRFILTIRDKESWYKSVSYHIGDLRSPMHEWLFGKGKGLPKEDRAHTISVYERHNQSVRAYFKNRPNDLLVLDISAKDGWSRLCAFLNVPTPIAAFPHSNKSSFERNKFAGFQALKYWKKRFVNPFKILWYDLNGHIPSPSERLEFFNRYSLNDA